MHDLMFTKEILTALKNRLNSAPKGTRIKAVNASLSPLSHVKPETLIETFNTMIKDTEFEDIVLNIKVLPLAIHCRACNHKFDVDKPTTKCPKCNNTDIDILHSKEFVINSLTLHLLKSIIKNKEKT